MYSVRLDAETGGNLCMLASYALVDAVEMEASGRTSAQAKKINGVRSIQAGSLPDDLQVTGPYKGVFLLDVVEHIEDDVAAVKALGNILADDGVLVLTVPTYQWMWSYHDEMNHHFRRYTQKGFVRVVEQAELEVVYSSYFNTILSPLAIMSRFVDKILGSIMQPKVSIGLDMPPAWINRILVEIFGLERHLAGRVPQPFGLSIAVVAKHGIKKK